MKGAILLISNMILCIPQRMRWEEQPVMKIILKYINAEAY